MKTGDEILDDIRKFLRRFIAFPSEYALDAVVLWVAHSHSIEVQVTSPRLAVVSPEPACGKSQLLEVLELLVQAPLSAVNASTAAVFRSLGEGRRTILFDEVDAIFGRHGKGDSAEELRAILNAGHREGATVARVEVAGKKFTVVDFPVFAACALAGIGDLPETVMTRSVIVRMRRRDPRTEPLEPFRRRRVVGPATELRDELAAWCTDVSPKIEDSDPEMPDGIANRMVDVCGSHCCRSPTRPVGIGPRRHESRAWSCPRSPSHARPASG
jgi:hypothetical protein